MLFFSYFRLNKLKMEERKTIMMTLMMMIDVKDDESDDVVGDDDNDFDEWRVLNYHYEKTSNSNYNQADKPL